MSHRPPARWFAERIFELLEAVMPKERKQWARAMRAEAAHVGSDATAVSFAAECLWVALAECVKLKTSRSAAQISAGLAAGFVFFTHSTTDGSGAWPLVWPLLGGAMAGWLINRDDRCATIGSGAWLGLKAGLVAGLLFAAGGAGAILWSDQAALGSRFHILAIGASLGAILSMVAAGAVTMWFRIREFRGA